MNNLINSTKSTWIADATSIEGLEVLEGEE